MRNDGGIIKAGTRARSQPFSVLLILGCSKEKHSYSSNNVAASNCVDQEERNDAKGVPL